MSKKKVIERMVKPEHLECGDTVGIVAPASSFDPDKFKEGIKKLRGLGYKVKYERAIFSKYWSRPGHDKKRAEQINRMFANKEVKAIFCAKAGYGSVGILPYLDKKIIRLNPKIFIGYSDITTLLLYLQKIANLVVFHGPVVSSEIHNDMHPLTIDYLIKLCSNPQPLGALKFPQLVSLKAGRATGVLVGGNMSLIVRAIGTPYRIETKDKILFLEDVGESFDVVRGYFLKMRRAGVFKRIKGLIFGKMIDCFDKEHNLVDVVNEIFKNYDIPILFGFPSGHLRIRGGLHVTLPMGVEASIDTDSLIVQIDEPAVS